MFLNCDEENNISCKTVWKFVSLTTQHDCLLVANTFFDRDFEGFLLLNNFLAFAGLTFILFFHNVSLSFTSWAVLLHLLNHWAHLNNLDGDSSSFAGCASFDVIASLSLTGLTATTSLNWNLLNTAIVCFFKSYVKLLFSRLNFGHLLWSRTSSASTSKEHIQNVVWISSSSSTIQSFLSKSIINFSFFGVIQCLVCLFNFCELNYASCYFFSIAAFVWMMLLSKFKKWFLNFGLRGFFVDAENIVVTLCVSLVVIVWY